MAHGRTLLGPMNCFSKGFGILSKLLFVAFCIGGITSVAAQEQSDEELGKWQKKSTEMYQQVLSPFCPGRSLNDCPSSKAQELKTEMLEKLKAGSPEGQILEEVFQRFGDQYRAIPKGEGFGRLVWLVPGAFVVIGLWIAFGFSARKKSKIEPFAKKTEPALAPLLTKEEADEVERELRSLE